MSLCLRIIVTFSLIFIFGETIGRYLLVQVDNSKAPKVPAGGYCGIRRGSQCGECDEGLDCVPYVTPASLCGGQCRPPLNVNGYGTANIKPRQDPPNCKPDNRYDPDCAPCWETWTYRFHDGEGLCYPNAYFRLQSNSGRWGYRKGENAGNSSIEEGGPSSQENVGIGGGDNEEEPVGRAAGACSQKCKDCQVDATYTPPCKLWCSKWGWCGQTDEHKQGEDCHSCA